MFYCLYCGTDCDDAERSLEHPIARSIGGHGWTIEDVCETCNAYCGREIDRPFASDPLIRQTRHRFSVPDARGEVPTPPRLYGKTKSGAPIELELGRDAPTTRRLPHRVSSDETGERYIVEPGEGERILALRIERLQRQLGPGYKVQGQISEVELKEDQDAQVELSMPIDLWPRLGAKLGLAFGARGMGAEWPKSEWAAWLRARLRGAEAEAPDGRVSLRPLPEALGSEDPLALLVDPPRHIIWFADGDQVMLMFHLFGLWRYVVPLGPDEPQDRPAWSLEPQEGTATEMPFIHMAVAGAERIQLPD